uniref:U3 small nucleolar ribonucleoprotein protein MPP10 n=1 Tax=Scapholeberis mucronata TaxID=202097 RepID=A0A4Y7NMC5_9CRUS|nr:EOG090X09DZ [Scapholeberis mucronata]SVE93737.1 EOG090X09DZ [Scapholeberis mucronata]
MASSIDTLVDRVLNDFNSGTAKPENFLSAQPVANATFKTITKDLYDFVNHNFALQGLEGSLPDLYIDGFDEEQIWQQLELHNEPCFKVLMKNVSKLLGKDKKLTFYKVVVEKEDEEETEVRNGKDESEDDQDSVVSDLSSNILADSDEEKGQGSDFDDIDDLKFDEYKVLDEEREERPKKKRDQPSGKIRKTEVDDEFFKVGEMERFLEKEEAKKPEVKDDDADEEFIDFFGDIPSDDEENEVAMKAKYKDFFKGAADDRGQDFDEDEDPEEGDEDLEDEMDEEDEDMEPKGKRVKFNFDDDSQSSDESSSEKSDQDTSKSNIKSNFEQRQERLKSKIQEMEDEAVAPKPWQLLGESKAELRPENALLEEDLMFEHTTRQAPVITEETTKTLEDIIRQRIKDEAFDDVERKIKPVYDPSEYKKKLVLDQEKSKFSLAEIYEQEYLKQQESQNTAAQTTSLADPLNKDEPADDVVRLAIRKRMANVFAKLDALCNFYYTPRMPAPDIKIVSNMPSITMEEIAPVAVSDANLLAPQEVQDPVRGVLKGSTEKEKTDRLRERRKKKVAQRVRHKERERTEKAVDKANPGPGNKHAKARVLQNLEKAEKEGTVSLIKESRSNAPKSSTAFFKQLQDDVAASVDAVKKSKLKNSQKNKQRTGSQLKL